jgi:hypothetical protein
MVTTGRVGSTSFVAAESDPLTYVLSTDVRSLAHGFRLTYQPPNPAPENMPTRSTVLDKKSSNIIQQTEHYCGQRGAICPLPHSLLKFVP